MGEIKTLAKISDNKSKIPPNKIDKGIKYLCFEENKLLIIWGQINPTKPIVPPAQTEEETPIAPVIKTNNLVFFISRPKVCAEISPTDNKSKNLPETNIKIIEIQKGKIKK